MTTDDGKAMTDQIAQALGIPVAAVIELAKHGMPIDQLDRARAWFLLYGRSTSIMAILASKQP